jgi:hypothetical protein
MSGYLSEVLVTNGTNSTAINASGGAGAPAPVLKEGDIQPAKKMPALKPKKVQFSKAVESALAQKYKECSVSLNDDADKVPSLDAFRAVYRRGAGSYDVSDTGTLSRHDWAMTRVNAFSALAKDAALVSSAYTSDDDLLPPSHPRSTGEVKDYSAELTVSVLAEDEYESQEQAVFALAELSGLGYETIPAIRAAWVRAANNNENPFERAAILASALYNSPDADLLPKKGIL